MNLYRGLTGGNPKTKALEKRPPKNPRYANIRSKLSAAVSTRTVKILADETQLFLPCHDSQLNTGMTVDKLNFITTRQHLKRQDEAFFRLAPSELSELLMEYEQDRQEGVHDFRDHIDPDHHGPKVMEHAADAVPIYERPYLILDVRDEEEFRRCHVTQARSFEANLLKQDHMTPELYKYKNKDGRLVVLYANDDRKACIAATTLINKGFDNVFVLSGGLVAFAKGFHSYIEGDMASLTSTTPHCRDRRSGGAGSTLGSNSGDARTRGSLYGNGCDYEVRDSGRPRATLRRGVSPSRGVSRSGSIGRAPWSEKRNGSRNLYWSSKQNGVIPVGGLLTDRRSLTKASATASTSRRQRTEGRTGEGKGVEEVSKGSAVTVADSVISRATARRGKW